MTEREDEMPTNRHLPSIEALLDSDDDRLIAELRAREVREYVAVARTLLDTIEALKPLSAAELAMLGCKIVEVANALSRAQRNQPELQGSEELSAVRA